MSGHRANGDESVEELTLVPFAKLQPHPLNANVMDEDLKTKLASNIRRSGRYPPLIVRPHGDGFQILDGEQRADVIKLLGEEGAWCSIWDVDDQEALILLSTLNRLAGEDVPGRRARLIEGLQAHQTLAELAALLPEGEAGLKACLAGIDTDIDALVEELEAEASRLDEERPEIFTFAVDRADADIVSQAMAKASGELTGKNRRGRALVMLAERYLEG